MIGTSRRLRVLLIRKDFKRNMPNGDFLAGLRVLLIRKDFKRKDLKVYSLTMFESLVNTEGF